MASQQYGFGAGTLVATSNVANSTPSNFAVLQDVEIDISFTMKELIGQFQAPVDIARGAMKVTGKAKFCNIKGSLYNDIFFGANALDTSAILLFALGEAHSVPGSLAYTVTVTNSATWVADQGVFYAATGVQLTQVASGSEAAGKYSVSAGVYTFASGDASAALLFNYDYTASSGGVKTSYTNQLMGSGPTFSVLLAESYNSHVINARIYAAKSSKLTLPLKNQDYIMQDFEFTAFAATALVNANVIDITTTN